MNNKNKNMPKIVVIGGGVTGCGTARDLVLRGYNVVLVEFSDLGSGTSSRFHGMLQSGCRYVVSDTDYAAECYRERKIIADIIPDAVELIGGFFVSLPEDSDDYANEFVHACDVAKIPCEEIKTNELLNKEKELRKNIKKAFQIPDAIINPWKLVNSLAKDIKKFGGEILSNHQVLNIKKKNKSTNVIEVYHNGIKKEIECDGIINASGPWSGRIAKLINQDVKLQLTKGSIIVFSHRIVNQAINRLRMPSSNDIMCPSGTVTLWGTTSEVVDDPNTTLVKPEEIQELLNGAEKLFPNAKNYRAFRAWAGVRPIVLPKEITKGSPLPRSHSVIDHVDTEISNMLSVCGGSLTTHRSMAEDVVNKLGNKFRINEPCSTHEIKINENNNWRPSSYFLQVENSKKYGDVLCECESILKKDVENLIDKENLNDFNDIRRRLRIGFGPCQGTFCTSRLAEIVSKKKPDVDIKDNIVKFCSERLKGSVKTSYGEQAKQLLLSDYIYNESLGLEINKTNPMKEKDRT